MATAVVASCLLPACLLPSYDKVEAEPAPTCGLSDELPPACGACVAEHCCELAEDCGPGTSCGADLMRPITPVNDVSRDFDPLLGCMQRHCDAACDVSWGCVGEYDWPEPTEDDYTFTITAIDFAAEPDKPLADMPIAACQGLDPGCTSGQVDEATTDEDGLALMRVPPAFNGYFKMGPVGNYLPSIVRWTEPLHRLDGFTHYGLTEFASHVLAVAAQYHDSPDQEFDPGVGHMIFRAQNCLPVRFITEADYPTADAADVKVSFMPNKDASDVVYTENGSTIDLTLEGTSKDGLGGAFNIKAGNITVEGTHVQTGERLSGGQVQIEEGSLSFIYLMPEAR